MPSKKVYFVLFIILIVFFILMFVLFGIPNIKEDQLDAVIVVSENTTWTYKNKRWLYLRNQTSIDPYNWSRFVVYENNEKKGEYSLWHDDKWYIFDEKKNAIPISGSFIAYQANYQMDVLPFQEENVTDMSYVYQVLEEHQLSKDSRFTSIYKVSVDFDQDSIKEDFYIISNAFPLDFEANTNFSIAFMVKNNVIYYLYQDVNQNSSMNACKPYYQSFINTNLDSTYEVILSCGKYSANDVVDMLYEFQEGQFKLLISNQ